MASFLNKEKWEALEEADYRHQKALTVASYKKSHWAPSESKSLVTLLQEQPCEFLAGASKSFGHLGEFIVFSEFIITEHHVMNSCEVPWGGFLNSITDSNQLYPTPSTLQPHNRRDCSKMQNTPRSLLSAILPLYFLGPRSELLGPGVSALIWQYIYIYFFGLGPNELETWFAAKGNVSCSYISPLEGGIVLGAYHPDLAKVGNTQGRLYYWNSGTKL